MICPRCQKEFTPVTHTVTIGDKVSTLTAKVCTPCNDEVELCDRLRAERLARVVAHNRMTRGDAKPKVAKPHWSDRD